MSTHNIGFYEDLTKIIFELSSNTHLISSAVWHHVQQVGLSATYQQPEGVYEYIRQLMALPFLPLMFDHLKRKANTEQLQRLVDYIDSHWFNHAVFDVPLWSVFQQAVRTNNNVEGYNL